MHKTEKNREVSILLPSEIEQKSFEIITKELGDKKLDPENELVIKRVIHTSADFDYVDNLCFSKKAVEKGMEAISLGVSIVTDTNMAKAGINKKVFSKYGGQIHCFIADEDVIKNAKEHKITRAAASIQKAASLKEDFIFAIGNAPTALMELYQLIQQNKVFPKLIIGVPVGFVNVTQSKEDIMTVNFPFIVAKGRKGGSNIAAAICNAILYQILD